MHAWMLLPCTVTSLSCCLIMYLFLRYQQNIPALMEDCFGRDRPVPQFLQEYVTQVYALKYDDQPDFSMFMSIFEKQLGGRDPTLTLEWIEANARA